LREFRKVNMADLGKARTAGYPAPGDVGALAWIAGGLDAIHPIREASAWEGPPLGETTGGQASGPASRVHATLVGLPLGHPASKPTPSERPCYGAALTVSDEQSMSQIAIAKAASRTDRAVLCSHATGAPTATPPGAGVGRHRGRR
jgi:hypothetical protein